jgi:hypothetical protein
MTTKHSPETWTANGEQITAFDADGFIVPLFERIDATEADMRLAAAAPALRDAAQAFLAWFKEFDGHDVWREVNEPGACPSLAALRAALDSLS